MERRKSERKKRKILYEKKIELVKKSRKHKRLTLSPTQVYILKITFTFNNIFYNVTDLNGNTKLSLSSGSFKIFKNSRKHTKAAALEIGKILVEKLIAAQAQNFMIVLKGVKHWRKKIVRLFVKQKKHFKIVSFHEEAPITFNGCRRQKKRRL